MSGPNINWLVVEPTPLKNISQNGNLLQVGVKNKKYLKPLPSQQLRHFFTRLKLGDWWPNTFWLERFWPKNLYPSIYPAVFKVPKKNRRKRRWLKNNNLQVKVYLVATCSFEVSLYSLLPGIFDISTFFFGETKTNRQAKNISKHCKQYPPENDHISHNQAGTFAWICVDDDFPAFPLGEICHILPCRMVSITYPPPPRFRVSANDGPAWRGLLRPKNPWRCPNCC